MKAYFSPKPEDDLEGKVCLVGISVGQSYHTSKKFEAVVKLVNKQNFKGRVLMVADTLQAWNILMKKPKLSTLKEARDLARQEGDKFLKENADIIKGYKIVRWDKFLQHNDFKKAKNYINSMLNDRSSDYDDKFKKAVNGTAGRFLSMHVSQLQQNGEFDIRRI